MTNTLSEMVAAVSITFLIKVFPLKCNNCLGCPNLLELPAARINMVGEELICFSFREEIFEIHLSEYLVFFAISLMDGAGSVFDETT